VIALTKSLANELTDSGVTVNSLAPAITETDLFKEMTQEFIEGPAAGASRGPLLHGGRDRQHGGLGREPECSFTTGFTFDHLRRSRHLLSTAWICRERTVSTARDMPLSIAHLSELEVPALGPRRVRRARRLRFDRPAHQSGSARRHRLSALDPAEQAEMRRRMAASGVSVMYIEMVGPVGANARVRLPADAGAGCGDRSVASRRRWR
jgi:hypothetical protein